MAYDLRDFVEGLRTAGELVETDDEVDWNFEIPAYEVLSGRFGGPAFLFNNIKGIPTGQGCWLLLLWVAFIGLTRRLQ